jgi:hypothetical protein
VEFGFSWKWASTVLSFGILYMISKSYCFRGIFSHCHQHGRRHAPLKGLYLLIKLQGTATQKIVDIFNLPDCPKKSVTFMDRSSTQRYFPREIPLITDYVSYIT